MNIGFAPLATKHRRTDSATSVCFYQSEKLDYDKHVQPLLDYLYVKPSEGDTRPKALSRDLLIFCQQEGQLPTLVEQHPQVSVFLIDEPPADHRMHFARYFSVSPRFADYEWVWFTGTDSLDDPPRYQRMESICETAGCQWIVRCSSTTVCCPNLRARRDARALLRKQLEAAQIDGGDWSCDDRFFNALFLDLERQPLPQLLNVDGNGAQHPEFSAHIGRLIKNYSKNIISSL